jgi:hypothetical protein
MKLKLAHKHHTQNHKPGESDTLTLTYSIDEEYLTKALQEVKILFAGSEEPWIYGGGGGENRRPITSLPDWAENAMQNMAFTLSR